MNPSLLHLSLGAALYFASAASKATLSPSVLPM